VAASIFEMKLRTSHQILDCSRHKHLRGLRLGLDSRRDIGGDATDVIAVELDLASMKTDPEFEVETSSAVANRAGALDGPRTGPSYVATKPSPVLLISLPRK